MALDACYKGLMQAKLVTIIVSSPWLTANFTIQQ